MIHRFMSLPWYGKGFIIFLIVYAVGGLAYFIKNGVRG